MRSRLASAICLALFAGNTAWAITDSDVNSVIPFNLANPGARSLGMGGAFLGLADDATAAFTNPAGLSQLPEPEVSIEGRHTSYSVPFVNGGATSIAAFDPGAVNVANADNSLNNVSFISVVFPHGQWSFAFYRDELVRYKNSFTGSLEPESVDFGDLRVLDVYPIAGTQSVKVVDYGASVSVRLGDRVALGGGLSYYRFDIGSTVGRFADNVLFSNPGTLLNQQVQTGSDNDVGVTLGALFKLSDRWSVGLAYRQGPKFNYSSRATIFRAPAGPDANGQFEATELSGGPVTAADLPKVEFQMPDVYALGLSWQPSDAWRVNLDVNEVMYSQITDGMQSLFGYSSSTLSRLSIPDGTEWHLGAEYTFTQMAQPFSIRAGVWRDPRHSIEYRGDPSTDPDLAANPQVVVPALIFGVTRGAQTHFALGAGMAFKQFQLDFGADFSHLADTYSLSAVWRF